MASPPAGALDDTDSDRTPPVTEPHGHDVNQTAYRVVADATDENRPRKDPAAVARGQKGGAARAAALTPERRRVLAQQAVRTRWDRERARREREAQADSA